MSVLLDRAALLRLLARRERRLLDLGWSLPEGSKRRAEAADRAAECASIADIVKRNVKLRAPRKETPDLAPR